MQEAEIEVVAQPNAQFAPSSSAYTPEALKEVVAQNRAERAEETRQRIGNRRTRRNFKRLWRSVREGYGYGNGSIHKYTKHQATKEEIKARRKNGRR